MKSKLTKLDGTSKQFNIEISKELVTKAFDEVLDGIRKEAAMPGFRQGKVPMDMVRKNFMKEAEEEVKRRLIPEAYQKALEEHEIDPVSYPEIWDVKLEVSGAMTFKARSDAAPKFDLAKYKEIKVKKDKISVSDAEMDEALTRIKNLFSELVDVERPIQKGDFGILDADMLIDGKVISKKRENMCVEADKESSLLGIGEQLCGLKKGDTKEIIVDLPAGYPDKKFAGKKAVMRIEVKGVREKKVPAMDDELAKKVGKEKIEDLKEEVKSRILESKEAELRTAMKNQIVEFLLKKHSFEFPPSMVKRQFDVLMAKAEDELAQKGLDAAAIETHKQELSKKLSENAKDKVKLYFVLNEIADAEKISVSEEEIDEWIKALAGSLNQPYDMVKKYYAEHDLMGGLAEQLREEKTLDFLVDEASVSEK